MKDSTKYTIRKLGFVLILVALIVSPFGVQEYKSKTTTDPYILIAREIESFSSGDVDVLNVEDSPTVEESVAVFIFIDDYSRWSSRIIENFNRHVTEIVRDYEYDEVVMIIGWGAPVEQMLIQRVIKCTNLRVLRSDMCGTEVVPGSRLSSEFIKWRGIGEP